VSILLDDPRIGRIKNAKLNSGIIDLLKALSKRPRDYSLITKYKNCFKKSTIMEPHKLGQEV